MCVVPNILFIRYTIMNFKATETLNLNFTFSLSRIRIKNKVLCIVCKNQKHESKICVDYESTGENV